MTIDGEAEQSRERAGGRHGGGAHGGGERHDSMRDGEMSRCIFFISEGGGLLDRSVGLERSIRGTCLPKYFHKIKPICKLANNLSCKLKPFDGLADRQPVLHSQSGLLCFTNRKNIFLPCSRSIVFPCPQAGFYLYICHGRICS